MEECVILRRRCLEDEAACSMYVRRCCYRECVETGGEEEECTVLCGEGYEDPKMDN